MLRHRLRQIETLLHRLAVAQRGLKPPRPRPLQTPQDLIEVLKEQIEALQCDSCAGPVEKARAIGYLAGIVRRAFETGKIADRLEMLEAVLKNRKGPGA